MQCLPRNADGNTAVSRIHFQRSRAGSAVELHPVRITSEIISFTGHRPDTTGWVTVPLPEAHAAPGTWGQAAFRAGGVLPVWLSEVRTSRWDYPGLSGGPRGVTHSRKGEGTESLRRRRDGSCRCQRTALTAPGCRPGPQSGNRGPGTVGGLWGWKRWQKGPPPVCRRVQLPQHFDFGFPAPVSEFDLQDCKMTDGYFRPLVCGDLLLQQFETDIPENLYHGNFNKYGYSF